MHQDHPRLQQLVQLFLEWNRQLNLSAIRDEAGVWEKHIADSLLIDEVFKSPHCPWQDISPSGRESKKLKVLDLGTGGGFPSLPLSVVHPGWDITAVDSVGKKLKAVQSMADELELAITTRHGRIEELGQHKQYREQFDLVMARALAPWPVLLEYALPFVKVGGHFVAYQGPQIREDLEMFKGLESKLGGSIEAVHETALGDSERCFVLIKKIVQTSKKYPRTNGVPRKLPLQ